MAPKRPPTAGSFKKGNVPISPGRPKLTIEQQEIRRATKEDLFQWYNYFSSLTPEQISEINLEKLPLFASGMLNSLLKFYESGDVKFISYILDQIIGKAKETMQIDGNVKAPVRIIVEGVDFERQSSEKTDSDI
jgi:hypothetical protein